MATTLVVTEKPDAALHVAEALSTRHRPRKVNVNNVPFFEVQGENERILICSALGHLYAVAEKEAGARSHYPVWDCVWKPKHEIERDHLRQELWIEAIHRVSKEADRFINACDYDREGSTIGYTILKYACGGAERKAQRMKFSTLTVKELREAYDNVLPELDFGLAFAGMCRHEVDWLYGINLSRALTQSALKVSHRYSTLSTGRVQGPTLRFIVDREREIDTFVPTPHWILKTTVDVDGLQVSAEHEVERFGVKSEAEIVIKDCAGRIGRVAKLESSTYRISPPIPFDLPTLQSEAYRHFGYTPRNTLGIAERLYLDQLISYPRTSSQKLPPSIGYEEVLKGLSHIDSYRKETAELLVTKPLIPNQGKKDDPAHPAVYPTGTIATAMESRSRNLFDLIVRRFLATFGEAASKQSSKATIKVGEHAFFLRGSRILKKGWIRFYGPYARFEEVALPPLGEGQEVKILEIELVEKYSESPSRYNPSSLLKAMQDAEIGTKATRADIIETLYRRGYVKEQRMVATPLALRVTEILEKYCPKVIDVGFTRELESRIDDIEAGRQSREQVVLETIDYLKPIVEELKTVEEEIGRELTAVVRDMWAASVTLSVPCPKCGSTLRVVKNPKSKKRFIGCAGKWKTNCTFSLPLPQIGTLTLLEKQCPECGFQLVRAKSKGHHPIVSCSMCYARKTQRPNPSAPTPVKPSMAE